MQIRSLCFLFSLYSSLALSTVFLPISIKTQIQESYGALHGKFLKKTYKVLDTTGSVITVASFQIIGTAGIPKNELLNNNEIKILYPGGVWQGIVYYVHGAPEFKVGEEVVLILDKTSEGLWIHNLSLGKYRIEKKNQDQMYLISEILINHSRYGKTSYSTFQKLIFNKFGQTIKPYDWVKENVSNKITIMQIQNRNIKAKQNQQMNRFPASTIESDEEERSNVNFDNFLLIILFGLIGGVSSIVYRKMNGRRPK